jgi:hypothetical protein
LFGTAKHSDLGNDRKNEDLKQSQYGVFCKFDKVLNSIHGVDFYFEVFLGGKNPIKLISNSIDPNP